MNRSITTCLPVLCLIVQAVVPGSSALAATPFDGTFRGTYYSSGAGGQCPPGRDLTINVVDGTFNVRSSTPGELVATKVKPDGSFSVQAGVNSIQGSIHGNDLTATASTGGRCTYLWSLKK